MTPPPEVPPYPASLVGPGTVLDALKMPQEGRVFDLDIGRFNGMPVGAVHPPFLITTYRTPQGLCVQRDQEWLMGDNNTAAWSFFSELIVCSMHSGTHMDGISHVMRGTGDGATWFGDVRASEKLGDFGPLQDDAASIPPLVLSGCLLDIPKVTGKDPLPVGYGITADDLDRSAASLGGLPTGGAVLIRTGHLTHWPDRQRMDESAGAGITLEAAMWLVEHCKPVAIGADTPALEQEPSVVPGNPAPCHHYLIRDRGIHILENLALDDLATAGAYHFLFICLPLAVSGASGSLIRPIAIT